MLRAEIHTEKEQPAAILIEKKRLHQALTSVSGGIALALTPDDVFVSLLIFGTVFTLSERLYSTITKV